MIRGTCVGVIVEEFIDEVKLQQLKMARIFCDEFEKMELGDIKKEATYKKVTKYILKDLDEDGNIVKDSKSFYCNPEDVKKNIENKVICIDNLDINDKGNIELIKTNQPIPYVKDMSTDDLDALLLMTGAKIINTACGHKCIIITYDETYTEIVIPSNVTMPVSLDLGCEFSYSLNKLRGKVKVIGGENIVDASNMFFELKLVELDLTEFRMDNLETAERMFNKSHIDTIIFPSEPNTFKLRTTKQMFRCFTGKKLDLTGLDTSNVFTMEAMFENCSCDELIIKSLNISKVITMEKMFIDGSFIEIDISNWEISKVKNTKYIFKDCEIDKEIILSDTDKNNKRIQKFRACWSKEERDAHPIDNWYHDMKKSEKYGYDYW